MIDRLNFYDLYGYLIPGLTLLGFLWLPFHLGTTVRLPSEWASAFAAAVLGYVAGHLLQMLGDAAFPHERKSDGARRRFSSLILDDTRPAALDPEFALSDPVRTQLKARIRKDFGLDVERTASEADTAPMERRRNDAFMLCRAALVQKGAAAYAQQFQGMYALMQGVTAAATIAVFYFAGWVASGWLGPAAKGVGIGLVVAVTILVIAAACPRKVGGWVFWLMAIAGGVAGLLFGTAWPVGGRTSYLLLGAGAAAFFIARRCYAAFLRFAQYFASTVYRDFVRL